MRLTSRMTAARYHAIFRRDGSNARPDTTMTPQAQLQRSITNAAPRAGTVLCALLALTAALSGCGREGRTAPAPEGLTPDEFVAVVVALREAEREVAESLSESLSESPADELADEPTHDLPDDPFADAAREDSAAVLFGERKRQILEEHDTSEEEVRAFILANGGDLQLLRTTWDAIGERLKHVRTAADESVDAARRDAVERGGVLEKERATEDEAVPSRPGADMRIVPDRWDLERIR